MSELKPCPFCGGEPKTFSGGPGNCFIECQHCGAQSDDGSEDRVTAAWNRRALSASIPADVEGLVERLEKRGNSLNGASPVGAGDGNTYALGFYDQFAAKDDREAASALRSQAQRIGELEQALEPFAAYAELRDSDLGDELDDMRIAAYVDGFGRDAKFVQTTLGDFRRARAALAKEGNGNG